jgi:GT2 family glycosyltransferase
MKNLSIIIINFKSSQVLRDCLLSLRRTDVSGGSEIIVYDNGPEDSQLYYLVKEFAQTKFIIKDRHLSFGSANNRAAEHATGKYLLFLNPDTYVRPGSINKLLRFIEKEHRTGAAGPRLVDKTGNVERSFGRDPGIFSEAREKIIRSLPKSVQNYLFIPGNPRTVDWISAAAMIVKREVFDSVGGFDEYYPLYFEDADLCRRIRISGWRIRYYSVPEVIHIRGAAGGVNADREGNKLSDAYLKYRQSQLRYYSKHRGKIQNMLLKLYLGYRLGNSQGSRPEKM